MSRREPLRNNVPSRNVCGEWPGAVGTYEPGGGIITKKREGNKQLGKKKKKKKRKRKRKKGEKGRGGEKKKAKKYESRGYIRNGGIEGTNEKGPTLWISGFRDSWTVPFPSSPPPRPADSSGQNCGAKKHKRETNQILLHRILASLLNNLIVTSVIVPYIPAASK